MLAVTFGLLFLYWILRVLFCHPSPFFKVVHSVFALLSLGLFLLLPKQLAWQPLLLIIAALSFSLFGQFRKQKPSFSSIFSWGALYLTGCITALFSLIFQHHPEQIVGRVILQGHHQSVWMSWKNPPQPQTESAWIPSYEVKIQDARGKTLYADYIVGDYVGIRAQVITIDWPYEFLGFSHLCRLELVHNGYATAQRHQFFPHVAYALPFSAKLLETVWNRLFRGDWKIPGVKSSTLESSYFPLRETHLKPSARQYDLIVGSTGLSSRVSRQ